MPNEGDLHVWWIPQIPMKAFIVPVKNTDEAILLLNALTQYDIFQYENRIKPDYSNAGGLDIFDDGEWITWRHPESGEDIDEIIKEME